MAPWRRQFSNASKCLLGCVSWQELSYQWTWWVCSGAGKQALSCHHAHAWAHAHRREMQAHIVINLHSLCLQLLACKG